MKTQVKIGLMLSIGINTVGTTVALWIFANDLDAYSNTHFAGEMLKTAVNAFVTETGRLPVSFEDLKSREYLPATVLFDHAINSPTRFICWNAVDATSDTLFVSSVPIKKGFWKTYGRVAIKKDRKVHFIPEWEFTEMIDKSRLSF